jgi:hypothetical protein
VSVTRRGDAVAAFGEIIDLRKASFVPMVGELQTAGIIHHMTLDAKIDPGTRELLSLETAQPAVAVEPSEATRGECCRDPAPRLQALVGKPLGPGFAAELQRVFGGKLGCSHLLTLFHLTASALPRALDFEASQQRATNALRREGELVFRRSVFLDGFQPEEGMLQLAVALMDYHSTPLAVAREPFELLGCQREVRVLVTVDISELRIVELTAGERERTYATLGSATWKSHDAKIEGLVGRPILPGLGTELRRRLSDDPEAVLLLDAMLQLAPGFVQCTPALTDRMLERFGRGRAEGGEKPRIPSFLAMGGATNSCYVWREDGPMIQIRPLAPPRPKNLKSTSG